MGYPVWYTPAGDLGKIAEQQYYNIYLDAKDLEGGGPITYKLLAGRFPPGIQMNVTSGVISGQPIHDKTSFTGVPLDTSSDVDYRFTIRAVSQQGYITDRSFKLTITGNIAPELISGEGSKEPVPLGDFLDGSYVNYQLEAIDLNINDVISWKIIEGELPLGLTLSETGLISGVAVPFVNLPNHAGIGWDDAEWDNYPWQFSTRSVTKNYTFKVQITDGKSIDVREFSMLILSHNNMRADNDTVDSDIAIIGVDLDEKRAPVLLTTDMGAFTNYVSDNYFSFKFDAIDLDGDTIKYELVTDSPGSGFDEGSDATGNPGDPHILGTPFDSTVYEKSAWYPVPGGLVLNEDTGWFTGYIPPQIASSQEYQFQVYVYKADYPDYRSKATLFTMNILSSLSQTINWVTPAKLGHIVAGEVSNLSVEANAVSGLALVYSLKLGSRLPEGLELLSDGTISGRCSFQSFAMDSGTTTFDIALSDKGFLPDKTVFDKIYKFTVVATNTAGSASSEREFSVQVDVRTAEPYENLYIRCLPQKSARSLFNNIVDNTDVFAGASIYRPNDPYWGIRKDIMMLAAYGVTASTASDYIAAMATRHYNKTFYFGNYGVNVARKDATGEILYEVLWVELIEDTRAYTNGVKQPTPASSVNLAAETVGWKNPNFAANDPVGYTLNPNDQTLMRKDITSTLGYTNPSALPLWMISVQRDGTVPGYVTYVPLAYLKPGEGAKILYRINSFAAQGKIPDIKDIPFVADRYVLDNNQSRFFDINTKKFVKHYYTIFDTLAKLPIESTPTDTVDFAVDIPFDYINGHTHAELDALGGLDSIVTTYDNKTIIFSTQERYIGYSVDNVTQGWIKESQFFDDHGSFDGNSFAAESIVPGYIENGANPNIPNQRAGIWKMTTDANGLIELVFQKELSSGEYIITYNGQDVQGYPQNHIDPGPTELIQAGSFSQAIENYRQTYGPTSILVENSLGLKDLSYVATGGRQFALPNLLSSLGKQCYVLVNGILASNYSITWDSTVISSWLPNHHYTSGTVISYEQAVYQVASDFTSGAVFDATHLSVYDYEQVLLFDISPTQGATVQIRFYYDFSVIPYPRAALVSVTYGAKHGGNILQYKFDPNDGLATVPKYMSVQPAVIVPPTPTTFDANSTRFLNAIDQYQLPDNNDKYLKFPKIGVFS